MYTDTFMLSKKMTYMVNSSPHQHPLFEIPGHAIGCWTRPCLVVKVVDQDRAFSNGGAATAHLEVAGQL